MALFGTGKDARFLLGVNREILHKVIDVEVLVYKIAMDETRVNIYGEAPEKVWYEPVRIHALIEQPETELDEVVDGEGVSLTEKFTFAFIFQDLVDKKILVDIGDIIRWDDKYYEVDLVNDKQYWSGRSPFTNLGIVENAIPGHGYSISVICETHLTRESKLNLHKIRSGINTVSNNINQKSIYR